MGACRFAGKDAIAAKITAGVPSEAAIEVTVKSLPAHISKHRQHATEKQRPTSTKKVAKGHDERVGKEKEHTAKANNKQMKHDAWSRWTTKDTIYEAGQEL